MTGLVGAAPARPRWRAASSSCSRGSTFSPAQQGRRSAPPPPTGRARRATATWRDSPAIESLALLALGRDPGRLVFDARRRLGGDQGRPPVPRRPRRWRCAGCCRRASTTATASTSKGCRSCSSGSASAAKSWHARPRRAYRGHRATSSTRSSHRAPGARRRGGRRAAAGGDEDASRDAARRAAEHHAELELLPPDLAGQVHALANYDFTSEEARQRFEQLLEQLRHELAQLHLDQAAGAMAAAGPEEREHLRAGLDALNKMIEQRAAGEPLDPSFEQFMEQFGDLFPGEPQDLDELLDQLAQRMAAASAMLASMTPEQRAQLQALMDELLGDMDLAWQIDRLGDEPARRPSRASWDQRGPFGRRPASACRAPPTCSASSAELDQLEQLLSAGHGPQRARRDRPRARRGASSARTPRRRSRALAELTRRLEEAGLVEAQGGPARAHAEGAAAHRQRRRSTELFEASAEDRLGDHARQSPVSAHERDERDQAYEFGDPFHLQHRADDAQRLRAALPPTASATGRPGAGCRVPGPARAPTTSRSSAPSTSEPRRRCSRSTSRCRCRCATTSLRRRRSRIALQALIASRSRATTSASIGFSATAREIRPEELPAVSWDFVYGTNMQHALALSRKLLGARSGTKQ